MGLFDKKICSFCGKDIGLLGNRSLADGNMCKDCSNKLSPWFTNRKKATIKDIEAQLQYRNQNETELFNFNPTIILGAKTKVFIDENKKAFVVVKSSDFRYGNPDIINFDQVLAVDLEIKEDKDEIFKEVDGKEVSYDPKQYEYEYTFYLDIKVRHQYFNSMRFEIIDDEKVNQKYSNLYCEYKYIADQIRHALKPSLYPEAIKEEPRDNEDYEPWICPNCGNKNETPFCGHCGKSKPRNNWFCPECGKENTGKFCIGCGTKKPDNI